MDLMRSEEMQLLQVIIPTESAHLAVSNLGDLGLIQFKDVRPPTLPAPALNLILPVSPVPAEEDLAAGRPDVPI
jgi:hypothetical protein